MASCINWTDQQWAMHFGMSVKNIPMIRRFVTEHYTATIVKHKETSKYFVAVYKYDISPSGFKRPILMVTSKEGFDKSDEAVTYANEQFLPGLRLTEFWAKAFGVPEKALQMLFVKER